jgi:hypothetical protein
MEGMWWWALKRMCLPQAALQLRPACSLWMKRDSEKESPEV